jgi:hypothetical protein
MLSKVESSLFVAPLGTETVRLCVSKLLSDFKACPNESAIGNAHGTIPNIRLEREAEATT